MAFGDGLALRVTGGKFYYGWVIVVITFTTSMITAGITGYGLSFFILPMSEDLGITRTQFSSVALFRLVLMPVVPLLGVLVDRQHGPRILLTAGGIIAGITLIVTSAVQTLIAFYLIYGIVFGLAMLAMGGMLVGPAVVSKFFVRKRGRAMAIGTMGISTGGVVIAPLAGWAISEFGWRTAWVILGVIVIFAISPISGLFMRRSPEDMGLNPDGDSDEQVAEARAKGAGMANTGSNFPWTVRQATRTRAFWIILVAQTLGFTALSPTLFHGVAYFQDKGLTLAGAAGVATTVAFFAVVSKLPWGLLTERMHPRYVLALCAIPAGLSLMILVLGDGITILYVYAVFYGLFMGGYPTIMNIVWPSYFGRQHAGAIRGFVTPVSTVIGTLSPVFAGVMWDRLGSYDFSFTIFAGAWVLAGLVMLTATPPSPPVASTDVSASAVTANT